MERKEAFNVEEVNRELDKRDLLHDRIDRLEKLDNKLEGKLRTKDIIREKRKMKKWDSDLHRKPLMMSSLANLCDGWIIGCDFALKNYEYDIINERMEELEAGIRDRKYRKGEETIDKQDIAFGERNALLWVLKIQRYKYEREYIPNDMNSILKGYADIKRVEAFKIENVENALRIGSVNKRYLGKLIDECQMGDALTPDELIDGTRDALRDLSGRDKQDMLDRLYELRKDELEENQMDIEHVVLNLGVCWDCM